MLDIELPLEHRVRPTTRAAHAAQADGEIGKDTGASSFLSGRTIVVADSLQTRSWESGGSTLARLFVTMKSDS